MTPKITDELGNRWRVPGGSPGARAVNKLLRYNYRLIVLPIKTLARGEIAEPIAEPEDVVSRVRLRECIAVLKEK